MALADPQPEEPVDAEEEAAEAPVGTPVEEPVEEDASEEEEPIAFGEGEDHVSAEVVVYGVRLMEARRQEVIDAAKQDGYVREVRKGDRTILRHESPYKGELVLHDDGRAILKRQPVRFEPPFGKNKTAASYLWCVIVPLCIRPSGQTVSPRRFRSYERAALANVAPEIREWNDAIADVGLDLRLERLPEQMQALWDDGTPLDDGARISTYSGRRAALFQFWNSRTETSQGEEVRDAVESFIRGVVQPSEHPFRDEEIARLNRKRTVRREFLAPKVRGP